MLLNRPQMSDSDVLDLACPLLSDEGLKLLHTIFEASRVDVQDLDDQRYTLRKKLAEVCIVL